MDQLEIIKKIQNTQNNIKVFTAVPMGVLMILYFFSYATLIDNGLTGFLFFEIVTTVLFVLALIFLNPLSFFVVRLLYGSREPYKDVMQKLTAINIVQPAEKLVQEWGGNPEANQTDDAAAQ